ncbi:uncharacterized protein LOC124115171 isoform X1 [Haliotis rufescens]|uniref:uncharacterized protein LOC124115171 isoform X1 n=1 Tax=Haliotis rufescens TaxID=6454 RepID=UPI001EB00F07|nr:uncharacterized protein LOC124115171 isoform X1 [Haliotis rufescens]XP_046332029.1 uncharacterized protein LOC124115171 isoform X1 [Haliotis rufescens]
MANPVISTREIKENILKCDRCEQQFDSEDKIPRVLPCQHSFCSQCLDDVWTMGSKLSCPSCDQLWDVRESVEETFPVEYVAMKFVVFVELKGRKGRRLCTDCSEKSPATHHCLNCQLYICEEGLRAHKRFYKQKAHKILSIAEILKLPENYLTQTETCTLHPGSTLDLFCEKPGCMKAVCPSCAIVEHKERDGHEIRDVQDVVKDEKRAVSEALEELKERQERTESEKSELERDLFHLNIESKKLEAQIERYFDSFIEQAEEQKEVLKNSLHIAIADERDHMSACLTAFKTTAQTETDYADYCRKVMEEAKPGNFLQENENIKQKLNALITAPLPAKPDRKEIFVDLTSLSDITKKMAKVGEIIYLDNTMLQWKVIIEITDSLQDEEDMVIVRVFLKYMGNVIVVPKPASIKAVIEDSSGLTISRVLEHLGDMGEAASTRSDEVDSPDARRHHSTKNNRRHVHSNGDSGYHNGDMSGDGRGTLDPDRYEENITPTEQDVGNIRYTPISRNRTSLKQTGSQKSIGVASSVDLQDLGKGKQRSRASYRQMESVDSKVSFNDDVMANGAHTSPRGADDRNGFHPPGSLHEGGSRSGATNRTGNVKRDLEATFELRFSPRHPGPHKVNFRLGGYAVEDEAFMFDSKEPAEENAMDRSLHFLTWKGESEVLVKSVKLPHITLSEDKLNREQCTITTSGKLVKSPSERGGSAGFSNYCGTTGSRCFSGKGVHYWNVTCNVRVLAKVSSFGKMILEAAVAHGDVLDNSYCVWETPRAWSLVVSICSTHKAICVKVVCNSKVLFDTPVMQCEEEATIDLDMGVMLNLDQRSLTFLDGRTGDVMWTFEDIDTTKSLWPVFGVYNRYHFSVELGVTSGDKLELNSEMSKAVEELL